MFIEVKAAFDKIVQLNDEFGGKLLTDSEAELADQLEKQKNQQAMQDLKLKLAKMKVEQKEEESKRLLILEEEMREQDRLKELKRQEVVEKQIRELAALRKYEIKMLVRIDKEFSDVTYVPASSLGMQIDILCKRNNHKRTPEEIKHLRPHYDQAEQIKLFDESSLGQSR